MNRRFSSSCDSLENQCIACRISEPTNCSYLADEDIGEVPRGVPTCLSRDANDRREVLRGKSHLRSCKCVTANDRRPSDVDSNLYSEESECGETGEAFRPNRHFIELGDSSTHEHSPPPRLEYQAWYEIRGKGQRGASKDESKSSAICRKYTRKKLSDMIQDIEREKTVRYYEKGGAKRTASLKKLLSPMNLRDTIDDKIEKYLRSLPPENIRKRLHPTTPTKPSPCKTSPVRCRYKRTPEYPEMSDDCLELSPAAKSASSNSESCFHPSPKKKPLTARASDGRDESDCRRRGRATRSQSQPKPPLRRDLFVIPDHTCREIPIPLEVARYEPRKSSNWDAGRRFISSPEFKYIVRNRAIARSLCKKSKEDEAEKKPLENTTKEQPGASKSIPRQEEENNKRSSAHHHRCRFVHEDTTGDNKAVRSRHHRKENKDDHHLHDDENRGEGGVSQYRCRFHRQHGDGKARSSKNRQLKHGTREKLHAGQSVMPRVMERESFTSSTKVEYGSESDIARTLPVTPDTDPEYERENRNKIHKDRETSTKKSKGVGTRGIETKQKEVRDKNFTNKRRQFDPNKVVYVDDTRKRSVSQHPSDRRKATVDSVGVQEKPHTKKIISVSECAPKKRSGYPRTIQCAKNEEQPTEVIFRVQSLEDFIKPAMLEDHRNHIDLRKDIVNEEFLAAYRKKYERYNNSAASPTNKGKSGRKVKKNGEYGNSRRVYNEDTCEACLIERLWAD